MQIIEYVSQEHLICMEYGHCMGNSCCETEPESEPRVAPSWRVRRQRAGPGFEPAAVGPYRGVEVAARRPRRRLEMPTGLATLVFGFGDKLHIECAVDRPAGEVAASSIVSVPHRQAHTGTHAGRIACIEVTLTPFAASRVLGAAMTEFDRPIEDMAAVLGRGASELVEQLAHTPDWTARFGLVDRFLALRMRARPPSCPPAVAEAWRRLQQDPAPRLEELCRELGWSGRQLRRLFERHVGLEPRHVAAVARMQRALRAESTGMTLGDVANSAGYCDHAHFDHAFKELVGMTPSRYRDLRTAAGVPDALTTRVPRRVTGLTLPEAPEDPERAPRGRAARRARAGAAAGEDPQRRRPEQA